MKLAECIKSGSTYQVSVLMLLGSTGKTKEPKFSAKVEIITKDEYFQGKPQIHCRLYVRQNAYTSEARELKFITLRERNSRSHKHSQYCRISNNNGTYTTFHIRRIGVKKC